MLEICFASNVWLIGHIVYYHLLSSSKCDDGWQAASFRSVYIWTMGPLAFNVLAGQNWLVAHSFEHMSSFFLHFGPSLTVTVIRWNLPPSCDFSDDLQDTLIAPIHHYFVLFAAPYFLFNFVIYAGHIETHGCRTIYNKNIDFLRRNLGFVGER